MNELLPLVLIPGTACDTRLFGPLLKQLGYPHTVILEVEGARSMCEAAHRILTKAPPRFLLCGFSLGGIASLEIVAQASDRVGRLVLIDTTARPDPPSNAAIRHKAVADARMNGMASFITDNWEKLIAPENHNNQALKSVLVAMAVDCGAAKLSDQAEAAIQRADSRPRLSSILQPTLVLAGEHEQVCSVDVHRELAAGIGGAELAIIPAAGHFSPLENPRQVAEALGAFLSH